MNVWTFSGRCAADAELRKTQSGESVLSFRVANDVGFKDNKHTNWVDCSYWGKRADAVANYIKKGDRITVSGELKFEEFQRRDGTPGSKLSVRVNDIDLASRNDGDNANRSQGASNNSSNRSGGNRSSYDGDRPLPPSGNRDGGNRSGSGGGTSRGGGKPAFDQDLDDEVPF